MGDVYLWNDLLYRAEAKFGSWSAIIFQVNI